MHTVCCCLCASIRKSVYTKFVIVQVHTYIRTYTCTYVYVHVHTCMLCVSKYMYIRTYVGMFVCAYNFMCTHSKCTSLAMSLHWLCITTLLSVYSACTHVHTHLLAICIRMYCTHTTCYSLYSYLGPHWPWVVTDGNSPCIRYFDLDSIADDDPSLG